MQNTIKMIMQLTAATTHGPVASTAAKIEAVVGDLKDPGAAISAITELASDLAQIDRGKDITPASEERAHAYNLCHMAIGLIHDRIDVAIPAFAPHELAAINEMLETKSQEVGSNQSVDRRRFYMEDRSEYQYDAKHHLVDLDERNGYFYGTLVIHQFSRAKDEAVSISLACNEVEEIAAIALQMRLAKANLKYFEGMQHTKSKPAGDDFDPFLDSNDMP